MESDPLPDHYKALGVDKTADAATIKAIHRKLVLKCHPDKVTDPALKEQRTDEFHRIQQAYETLIDDEKRADYDAHVTLAALRKEKAARASTAARSEKTARFDVRTAATSGTSGGAAFTATGPPRYSTEERKPSRPYDDDHRYFDDRARSKYDPYDAYASSTASRSARPEKESSSRGARPAAPDRTRSDRNKTRDKESRSERKFASVEEESSSDEKARYEAEYRRRSAEDEARKQAAEARRKAEERRGSYEDPRYTTSSPRKMSAQEEEAIRYQHKSRGQVEAEIRPSPSRTASSRDYYAPESRSSRRELRPEMVRRSSARPKERLSTPSGREKDRGYPEIVDWGEERRPPLFKHTSSSPANIELPRAMPQRSYTETNRDQRSADKSPPPPSFHRSATMPSVPHSSSRRKEATARPSTLRETMTPERSPERDAFPSVPPPQPSSASKVKYYHYPTPGGGVSVRPEDLPSSATHRTVLREPATRHHARSPSPLGRPPIGPNRPSDSASTASYAPKAERPPPMTRANTSARVLSPGRVTEDRGRTRPSLYGEVGRGRQASFSPDEVQYTRKYGPEDVRWAPKSRENTREYASKPTLSRMATTAY